MDGQPLMHILAEVTVFRELLNKIKEGLKLPGSCIADNKGSCGGIIVSRPKSITCIKVCAPG